MRSWRGDVGRGLIRVALIVTLLALGLFAMLEDELDVFDVDSTAGLPAAGANVGRARPVDSATRQRVEGGTRGKLF